MPKKKTAQMYKKKSAIKRVPRTRPRGTANPATAKPTMRGGTVAKRGRTPKVGGAAAKAMSEAAGKAAPDYIKTKPVAKKPRVAKKPNEHKARKPKASKGASKPGEHKARKPKRVAKKPGEHTARKPKVSKGASKGRIEHKAKNPAARRGGTAAARKPGVSKGASKGRIEHTARKPKPSRNVATGGGHHNLFDDYNKWNTKFHANLRGAAAQKLGMGTGSTPSVPPTKKRKK